MASRTIKGEYVETVSCIGLFQIIYTYLVYNYRVQKLQKFQFEKKINRKFF